MPMQVTRRLRYTAAAALVLCAAGAGSTTASAEAAQRYKLNLHTIYCESTEDWTGADEPYLLVNGSRVWGNASMNNRESEDIYRTREESGSTEIRLYDEDAGGIFDPDDLLGTVTVDESQIDQGTQQGHFIEDGANYTLYYTVEAA
jgi:hypothetical protein